MDLPSCIHWRGSTSFTLHSEVIEVNHRVCLCPETDLASFGERAVFDLEQFLIIKEDSEKISFDLNAQLVPAVAWYSGFRAIGLLRSPLGCQRNTLAFLHLVEHDIIFQGVGSNHVIVVSISKSPH